MERKELLTQEAGESGNSTHNYRHQRTENRDSKWKPVRDYSQQHNSQGPKGGNDSGIHQR